ncbi:MAG: chitinase [Chitinophagaceae bacterium]|jgi:basic endochitinase B|nr:chitinase [Chitinophagaceae bacterium]
MRIFVIVIFVLWRTMLLASPHPIERYLNKTVWNKLFPNRYALSKDRRAYAKNLPIKEFYSYEAFLKAAQRFPDFLKNGSTVSQKRELAAFLATMAHETSGGWDDAPGGNFAWGLYFVEENGCENGCPHYSDTTKKLFPPVADKSYHGRGPIQLSWNYNYAQFSKFYFGNQNKLLNEPELVSKDPVLCFASLFWFWTTPQYPKPSCNAIMSGQWIPEKKDSLANRLPGFGAVMNIINGGLECGSNPSPKNKYRLDWYYYFCKFFGVSAGPNSSCSEQKPFGT